MAKYRKECGEFIIFYASHPFVIKEIIFMVRTCDVFKFIWEKKIKSSLCEMTPGGEIGLYFVYNSPPSNSLTMLSLDFSFELLRLPGLFTISDVPKWLCDLMWF